MAHSRGKGDKYQSDANETVYYPDHLFSLMVCTDQQQLCNPNNNMCSPWGSRYDLAMNVGQNVLGFNPAQLAVATRFFGLARFNAFPNQAARGTSSEHYPSFSCQLDNPVKMLSS